MMKRHIWYNCVKLGLSHKKGKCVMSVSSIPYRYEKLFRKVYDSARKEARKDIYSDVLGDTTSFENVIYKCLSEIIVIKNKYDDYSREYLFKYYKQFVSNKEKENALNALMDAYDNLFLVESLQSSLDLSKSNWNFESTKSEDVELALISRASSTIQNAPSALKVKMDNIDLFQKEHLINLLDNGFDSNTPIDSLIKELFYFYKGCYEMEWETPYEKAPYIELNDYDFPETVETEIITKAFSDAKNEWNKGIRKLLLNLIICAILIIATIRIPEILGVTLCIVLADLIIFIPSIRASLPTKPIKANKQTYLRDIKYTIASNSEYEKYKKED